MSKKQIWLSVETEFIGATGCNTVREMAELAHADTDVMDALEFEYPTPTVDDVESRLFGMGVTGTMIAAARVRQEKWDMAHTWSCNLDDKPGRGYCKVLGVSL
ncbi:hypothetical protein D6T64_11935 [Cryobacterium melibiosiphilum]|uniref:Uncharacterized protein n=1 Tax=Cryobacterium melibiosiphilum TaxID=995039 RepID=A0A3A5MMH7_9MICO|nr:hypothetical protein [Cryobacterium melibiosiphilum]RJT88093.1 hypothetical protein D6T64_11935 [Cryobacterium melibiosiphilum]